jgi:hypothetical protein
MLQPTGFYYRFSDGSVASPRFSFKPVYIQNHVDTLLGLGLLYLLTSNRNYLSSLERMCNSTIRYAISGNGFLYGSVIPWLRTPFLKPGFLRHKPQVSGIFIEELANAYVLIKSPNYLGAAEKMARAWINTESFRKFGVCVDNYYPLINRPATRYARISKENVNFMTGITRLLEVGNQEWLKGPVSRCVSGLGLFRNSEGAFYSRLDSVSGKVSEKDIGVAEAHMAMGALLDAHIVLKSKEPLKMAEECAEFWIGMQESNGLFPTYAGKEKCEIDPHMDFVTILSRLYMMKKKKEHKDSLIEGALAISNFMIKEAYCKTVSAKTGKPMLRSNELKFLGGALKGLMSAYTAISGGGNLGKMTLRLIMRDR